MRAFCWASTSEAEVAMYSHRPLSIQRVTDTGGSTPCEKSLRPRRIGSFSSLSHNVVQHGPQWCSRGPGPTDLARYAESLQRLSQAREGTRNHQLNTASFNMGRLVAAGAIEEREAAAALIEQGQRIGLGHRV